MPDFPVLDGHRYEAVGHVTGSSTGTAVATGTANVKTAAWVELIAATAFDAAWLTIQLGETAATACDYLLDIAIGGAGAEVVLVANLLGEGSTVIGSMRTYTFPISVPAGSRISAKAQSNAAVSQTLRVTAAVRGQGMMQQGPGSHVTTYGANTAATRGVPVDAGATANTVVWAEVSSATTRNHCGFVVGHVLFDTSSTLCSWLVRLGVGAGGAEQTIATWLMFTDDGSDIIHPGCSPFIPVIVPAGSRLAVGVQCSTNVASDRVLDAVAYGVS